MASGGLEGPAREARRGAPRATLASPVAVTCALLKEVLLPLETRSVPRQIFYLMLALIGLLATLSLFVRWQL